MSYDICREDGESLCMMGLRACAEQGCYYKNAKIG